MSRIIYLINVSRFQHFLNTLHAWNKRMELFRLRIFILVSKINLIIEQHTVSWLLLQF